MPPKAKLAAKKPTTEVEWRSHIQGNGKGRSSIGSIGLCFDLDKNGLKTISTDIEERIESIDGFPALIQKCRGEKIKGPRDQSDVDNKTRQVERWLAEESQHAHLFGSKNTQTPEAFRKEAARKLVFDAKARVYKNLVKMETDIDAGFSPTKPKQPPSRAYTRSPFTPQPSRQSAGPRNVTLFARLKPSTTALVRAHVRNDHRLLQDRISNLLQFNVRLVDSRTQSTITRLPFRYLLSDMTLLKTATGGFTGDDVSRALLVEFVQQEVALDIVKIWKEHGHDMELTHAQEKPLADDDDFAVIVNDFINEPRQHTDLCVTLVLSTSNATATGHAGTSNMEELLDYPSVGAHHDWGRFTPPFGDTGMPDADTSPDRTPRPLTRFREDTTTVLPRNKKKAQLGVKTSSKGKERMHNDAVGEIGDGGDTRTRGVRKAAVAGASKTKEIIGANNPSRGWDRDDSDDSRDEYLETPGHEPSEEESEGEGGPSYLDMDLT